MKQEHAEWSAILAILVMIILFVGLIMVSEQRDALKQEAVDKGFAEWHIISGTRKIEFKWKELQKP